MTQTTGTDGSPDRGWAQTFFGVIARRQTWLNLAYLVLAFPLGLAYFILLVVGLSVSISLVIIVVGIPILLGLILLWRVLGNLERVQGRGLLGLELPSSHLPWGDRHGFWAKIGSLLTDRTTWLDLLFLLVKFPLGVVSFVLVVTGFTASVGFMAAPLFQQVGWLTIGNQRIDSWPYALALAPVGFLALFASLHVLNGWAWMSARLADALLAVPEVGTAPTAQAQGQWPQPPQQGVAAAAAARTVAAAAAGLAAAAAARAVAAAAAARTVAAAAAARAVAAAAAARLAAAAAARTVARAAAGRSSRRAAAAAGPAASGMAAAAAAGMAAAAAGPAAAGMAAGSSAVAAAAGLAGTTAAGTVAAASSAVAAAAAGSRCAAAARGSSGAGGRAARRSAAPPRWAEPRGRRRAVSRAQRVTAKAVLTEVES